MKKVLGNIALAACSLLVLFLLAETYFAIRAYREHDRLARRYEDMELCSMPHDDRRLVYTIRPHQCGANSLGFFDREHEVVKSPRTYRILVIGDSVAQGQGVPRNSSFPMRLQTRLDELDTLDAVEVIVMARSGYSTSQELIVLDERGFDFDPDLIIWSYVLNDPAHPIFHDGNGEMGRYFSRPGLHTVHYVRRKVFEIRERIAGAECNREFHLFLHCAYRNQVVAHVEELGRVSRASGVPIVFVIHPVFEASTDAPGGLHEVHRDLSNLANEAGMRVIDMLEVLRDEDPDAIRQTREQRDPWHPSTYGHALIASELEKALVPEYVKLTDPGGGTGRSRD